MTKKNNNNERVIMRHILEVKLYKRVFSFMDFRGRMVDHMTEVLKSNQIRLQDNGTRFDIADDQKKHLYFFSVENFGFQTELNESFESFADTSKNLLDALMGFPDYKVDSGFIRIGTKSVILYHRKGDSLESIKDSYKDILVKDHDELARLTKSEIKDTAYTFDLKLQNSSANISTGPVTKDEALGKFFDNRKDYGEDFNRENGMLLSIDVSGDAPRNINGLDGLSTQIYSQIKDVETVYDGFRSLFSK